MDMNEFRNSKWVREARDHEARAKVTNELPRWSQKVSNAGLVEKAWHLWDYLTAGKCSAGDVILIVATLLYLTSPIDTVPDVIPVLGWLDDLAIASLVLAYLQNKASSGQRNQFTQ